MRSTPTPIAIVGMSCRLPGEVSTPDDLWTLISRGRDGWSPVPADRLSTQAFHHPNPQKAGCFNQQGGYFLRHDLSRFDAPFFQITQAEAIAMDPQQRQLLECTYEALENAGIPKESIAGRNVGVFVGGAASEYRTCTLRDVNQVPMFDSTGNHQSIQAGRISYYFDLRGPSSSIDTACSSGLYALHAAVQSLRAGESESAIVAASQLYLQPDETIAMSMLGLFNDEGKTYSFDHRAKSGFARGEGVGCLILKPLDQAIKDNDKIRSVIVNTGTAQDGRTTGITTPSGDAQERLMRDVYARANISPNDTGFVEAHGTGTKVGDPIEAGAIHRVFGSGRTKRAPLYLGSVKSNVGHLINASGIISVIKATMMLEKGFILPNVNFEKANDAIPLSEWNIKVPVNTRLWPKDKRFVSINNFGFGGSNAHAVLERPPWTLFDLPQGDQSQHPRLLVFSAHEEDAARTVMSRVGIYVEQHPEVFQKRLLGDIAYTLGQRRSHLPWRIAVTASSCDELVRAINSPAAAIPRRISTTPVKLAFVYTGQGAQWARMGVELMDSHPVYSTTLKAAAAALSRLGADFDLLEELSRSKEESHVAQAHISQPLCTAVQLGLTALLASWGVGPSMVIGHSSGEIGAAFAAGRINLDDAMAIAYFRGKMAATMKLKHPDLRGAMLAVGAGPAEVGEVIQLLGLNGINIACENSPNSVTVSGDELAIDELACELETRSIFNRKLRVDTAYHSSHMNLVAEDYTASLASVVSHKAKDDMIFYSSLRGERSDLDSLDSAYWVENLTRPVLFSTAMRQLCVEGKPDVIIEVGPHSALEGPIKQILKGIDANAAASQKYCPSLTRGQDATVTMLKLAGNLFTYSCTLDFSSINQTDAGAQKPSLVTDFPPYPWANRQYWFESRTAKQHRLKPFARQDLLGSLEDAYSEVEPVWRNVLSTDDIPWLKDHRMQSLTAFPLAGYLCMAVEAAFQRAQLRGVKPEQLSGFRLREVQVSKAFILDDGVPYETVLTMKPQAEGTRSYSNEWDEFSISTWTPKRGWLEHCRGLIAVRKLSDPNPVFALDPGREGADTRRLLAKTLDSQSISHEAFYKELEQRGAGYESAFVLPTNCELVVGERHSTCNLVVPDTSSVMPKRYEAPSILKPALVDLFFHPMFAILGAGRGKMPTLFMPSAIKEAEFNLAIPNQPGEPVQVVVCGAPNPASLGPVDFSIDAWHAQNAEPVVKLAGLRMTPLNGDEEVSESPRSLCYQLQWHPLDEQAKEGTRNGHENSEVVIVTDRQSTEPLVAALVGQLSLRSEHTPAVVSLSTLVPSSSANYIFLVELDTPLLLDLNADAFAQLQNLLLKCSSVLWVSAASYRSGQRPENNLSQGLLRTIRSETGKTAASLEMETESKLEPSDRAKLILDAFDAVSPIVSESGLTTTESEFAEMDGRLVVPRITEHQELNLALSRELQSWSAPYPQEFAQPGRRLKVVVKTPGALDSLYWTDEAEQPLADGEIEIEIAATGMNFKDVVIAMGQVPSPYIGVECSGTVARVGAGVSSLRVGDRVCAMSVGAYGTYTRCPATSAARIPANMSFEVAASIPVVYSTAYYGIMELARMEAGETILIHAASGGVGQAAIQLAQMVGAEIYASVGSAEKKQFLIDTYSIPAERIFYSRNGDFGSAVRAVTNGRGVDVVINSLAGDLLRESWESLAPFGRFIEIGKRDILSNTRLEMAKFEHNCTFSSVDLTLVAADRPKIMGRVLTGVMNLLARGIIHPIGPIETVPISEVESALRRLQSGKTSGKMVVSHTVPGQQVKATHPKASPSLMSENASYIIIGGTGGLGRSMCKRMVKRGARHIVLLSRRDVASAEVERLVKDCQELGASVYVKKCDAAEEDQVSQLVAELGVTLPPIRGVIHAAMVLNDVLFENMSFDNWNTVVRSKVQGAWNFHRALRDTTLDFFILLSSVAGIVGNRGQAAYAAANTYLDALAAYRQQSGLSAVSLNLAAIGGAGYLAENDSKRAQVLQNLNGSVMNEQELLALIEATIEGKVNEQCITGLGFPDDVSSLPYYASDAKFSILRDAVLAKASADGSAEPADATVSQKLGRAADAEQARDVVGTGLRDKIASILMLPAEVVEAQQATASITALGLDSLTAIELRNWIGKELQAHLQVLELLTSGHILDLAALVLRKTRLEGAWATGTATATATVTA